MRKTKKYSLKKANYIIYFSLKNTNQFTNEPENKEKADYVQNIVEIVQKQ